jgi:hypothetical protein
MFGLLPLKVQIVQAVQVDQTPSFILPRDAGEERGGGIERSAAVERLERFELSFICKACR